MTAFLFSSSDTSLLPRAVFARGALAVLPGHSLELRGRLAQVLQDHHGMYLDFCPQREHEGFDQGGDLGCLFHVDDNVRAPGTIYIDEVGGLRLEVFHDRLDSRT